MATSQLILCFLLTTSLGVVSCVAPKAVAVAETPVLKTEKPKAVDVLVATPPAAPPLPPANDGIRMPNMLAMPTDRDLRTTHPVKPKSELGSGAVISRPPMDPATEQKPTASQ